MGLSVRSFRTKKDPHALGRTHGGFEPDLYLLQPSRFYFVCSDHRQRRCRRFPWRWSWRRALLSGLAGGAGGKKYPKETPPDLFPEHLSSLPFLAPLW